jgi:hypothetical protein
MKAAKILNPEWFYLNIRFEKGKASGGTRSFLISAAGLAHKMLLAGGLSGEMG